MIAPQSSARTAQVRLQEYQSIEAENFEDLLATVGRILDSNLSSGVQAESDYPLSVRLNYNAHDDRCAALVAMRSTTCVRIPSRTDWSKIVEIAREENNVRF